MASFEKLVGAAEFTPSWLKKKPEGASPAPKAPVGDASSPPVANSTAEAPTRLSPDAVVFVPRGVGAKQPQQPPVAQAAKPSAVEVVEKKSVAELLAISSKSTFKLSAATFVPKGFVNKAVKLKSPAFSAMTGPTGPMVLRDTWSLYFIDRSLVTEQCFDPILVFRMDSVEEFWKVFNNIPEASKMPPQSTYYLFRSDIAPKWEDERNRTGGCWQLRLPSSDESVLDGVWLRVCCRTIGESWAIEEHRDSLNGLVLKSRDRFHTLQFWVTEKKEAFPRDVLQSIEEDLPAINIDYFEHSTLREHSAAGTSKKKKSRKGY